MSRRFNSERRDGATGSVLWGVDRVAVTDPAGVAPTIAIELGAEVIADAAAARAAVDRRVAVADRWFDETDAMELRRLAGELARADRIRSRTEDGFRDVMAQRLARTSGIAIHPNSIRHAAAAILGAERALAEAETALANRARTPVAPVDTEDVAMFDEDALDARHRICSVGVALAVCSIATGLVAGAVGLALPIAAGLAVIGVAVSAGQTVRALRGAAEVTIEPEPGARSAPAREPDVDPLLQRTRAEERLRSARRHWETLAGPRADPHDLDSVLRAHDPQFDLAAAAAASPTIRAVGAVHRRAAARWRVAWAELGYDEAPSAEHIEEEIERLRAGVPRPIVLVEPARWLDDGELAELVAALPAATPVTIVDRKPARSLKAG